MFYTRRVVTFAGLALLAMCISGCTGSTTIVITNDSTSTATITAVNLTASPILVNLPSINVAPGKSVSVILPYPKGSIDTISSLTVNLTLSNAATVTAQSITITGSITTGKTNKIDIIVIDDGAGNVTTSTATNTVSK